MEMFLIGLVGGLAVGVAGMYFLLISKAGGKASYDLGMKVASRSAQDPAFAARVDQLFAPPPPPKPSPEPIRLLGLLQRESRLLDFLMENISSFSNDQIGASVREIHAKAQATLKKHLSLDTVMGQEEGSTVTVNAGFDPSAIRLVGQVTGQPPFKGVLVHPGWKVKSIDLPKGPEGTDEFVLMPAEVEI
ncbi:MAG: DUF2760 domain-containing protein [Planctomycetes bacterium]|nr:DUF2760 domain-containing protein [Planctomycetota bacterium]